MQWLYTSLCMSPWCCKQSDHGALLRAETPSVVLVRGQWDDAGTRLGDLSRKDLITFLRIRMENAHCPLHADREISSI